MAFGVDSFSKQVRINTSKYLRGREYKEAKTTREQIKEHLSQALVKFGRIIEICKEKSYGKYQQTRTLVNLKLDQYHLAAYA